MGTWGERALVRRLVAGDQRAQQRFYTAYRDRLYKTCVHFLGYQDVEAEDIVQETFMIAHQKIAQFEFKCKLSTWMTQIAVNQCFERLRQRKRMLLVLEEDIETMADQQSSQPGPGQPSEEQAKENKLGLIRRMLTTLGEQCRRIIELRDFEGISYAGISKVLHVPIGTVMSRLHRCRSLLKQRVQVAVQEGL